ncbi:MAG TPA: alanine racemase, partial [Steroidobacteraceae bacterium]|nr:alanine racemase [Steroidobacteraceae bacterium]
GCDTVELAREFGTPLYVVDERKLRHDYNTFVDSFRKLYPNMELGYSYKTNPLPEVIRVLHDAGALAECISHFELWLALQLGVEPKNIIFNGPAKTPEALDLAVQRGVKLINIDGMEEIELVAAAAARHGIKQAVGIRVVTSQGWQAQFGLRLRTGEARQAFKRILEIPQLHPVGLHVHLGTGIKDVPTYLQAIREMLEFARELAKDTTIRINYFDFGGGFGVPSVQPIGMWDGRLMQNNLPIGPVDTDATPRIEDYARGIAALMHEFYKEDLPTIAFEPGRAISSSAQSLLLEVLTVKQDRDGTTRAILNGGKNYTLPMGYEYHEMLPAARMNDQVVKPINFYGPLCHPGDVLFLQKPFPQIATGDPIAVMDAGAYFVPNQMNFSNPRPAVVICKDGQATLVRRRETFEDMVRLDQRGRPGPA